MGLIIKPDQQDNPLSGIISNEKYNYSKEDTLKRLEEIHAASYAFVATKQIKTCTMILTTLCIDDFYTRFRIDYWNDVTDWNTRFKDLIELSLMYKQLKNFLHISKDTEGTTVTFDMGQALMQEIANKTEKLYFHRYEKIY